MKAIAAVVYLFLFAPGAFLFFACRRGSRSSRITACLFLVGLGSWLLLLSDFVWRGFVGFDYSSRRFLTIELNLAAAVIGIVLACFARSNSKWWLVSSSGLLALDWLYMAAVSSVV